MVDFGISHCWAMSQAVKCRFLISEKCDRSWHEVYWEFLVINSHKGVKKYSPGFFFLFLKNLSAVRTMADLVNFDVGGQRIKHPFTG